MKKILAVSIITILVILTYASLAGENNKISGVAVEFFQAVKEQDYAKAYSFLSQDHQNSEFHNIETFSDFSFLLETSLLNHFNLLEQNDYLLKENRNGFWLPFSTANTVGFDILLYPKVDTGLNSIFSFFSSSSKNDEYIENLLTISREDGAWKIKKINFSNSPLAEKAKGMLAKIDSKKYFSQKENYYTINPMTVDLKKITPLEKRTIKYTLQKMLALIESNGQHP